MKVHKKSPTIGVAIVNYQTPELVQECLACLSEERLEFPGICVAVVDNFSQDDSVHKLQFFVNKEKMSSWVKIIPAPKNGGFSYGNNIAFNHFQEHGGIEYLWMLNPDTKPLPGGVRHLLTLLENDPKIGMVGSRLQDIDGTAQVSAFNFPSVLGELISSSRLGFLAKYFPRNLVSPPVQPVSHKADWLAGASILFPLSVLNEVGHMDENYFLYFEEVDFCRKVKKAKYEIWYQPLSKVVHHVGASTGISDSRRQSPRRPRYWFESRRYYFLKNHGVIYTMVADAAWVIGYVSWKARNVFQRKSDLSPPKFLWDFIRYSSFFNKVKENEKNAFSD